MPKPTLRLPPLRPLLVAVHRYVGLVLAGFLLLAGLTGSLLAWNDELEAWISPQLFRVEAAPAARLLDPLLLRERVAARYPDARVGYARLRQTPGHSVKFLLFNRVGATAPLPNDQVFVHPATGEVLGERRWGDLSQGARNLMPFVYRLHHSLALGTLGSEVFGIVALLWTLDCFVGAYLTFPLRAKPGQAGRNGKAAQPAKRWLSRWWPAWKLRWGSSGHKLNVDLHRCSGLWPWAMLFVLAWSSVAFNLTEVYKPTMAALVSYQPPYRSVPALAQPQLEPGIGWNEARDIGRRLMAQAALQHHFVILEEEALVYDPAKALYRYDVLSSLDPRDRGGATSLYFDANHGTQRRLWLPTGAAAGDTIRVWLAALHMAAAWGWPFKVFVCAMGLAVAALSVTGVLIWLKKRRARTTRPQRALAMSPRSASALTPATHRSPSQ